jgi:hypothetical protein
LTADLLLLTTLHSESRQLLKNLLDARDSWVLKETPSLNKTCVKQTKDEASTSCHLPSSPEGVEESLLLEIPFHQSAPY